MFVIIVNYYFKKYKFFFPMKNAGTARSMKCNFQKWKCLLSARDFVWLSDGGDLGHLQY